MQPTLLRGPMTCGAISSPDWHVPAPSAAPGSWFLLAALALVCLVGARWMLAPLPTWRMRVAVVAMYGVADLMLISAVLVLALVVPAYRYAAELQFLTSQPFATPTALSCALTALNSAHGVWINFEQEAQILLGGALLLGGGAAWMRASRRTGRPSRVAKVTNSGTMIDV